MAFKLTLEQYRSLKADLEVADPYTPDDPEYNMLDGNTDPARDAATLAKMLLDKYPDPPDA